VKSASAIYKDIICAVTNGESGNELVLKNRGALNTEQIYLSPLVTLESRIYSGQHISGHPKFMHTLRQLFGKTRRVTAMDIAPTAHIIGETRILNVAFDL